MEREKNSIYRMGEETWRLLFWEGRILSRYGVNYMGYTNSSVTMQVQGDALSMYLTTGNNEQVNQPGLRIYVDGEPISELVLEKRCGWYEICRLNPAKAHTVRLIKITEAAMSYVGVERILVSGGRLLPQESADERTRVEFIGDSITCGYGVHGAPESEYTIREEDGECSYAAFMAKEMNWNARFISASGYGMYVEYTGDPKNNVPKLYPYVNWFLDTEQEIKEGEFEPRFIFVNLGTNDSGHLGKPEVLQGFLDAYKGFLEMLRARHRDAVIICVLGTLCRDVFPYVEQTVERVKQEGMEDVYALELPFHNVQLDGMASNHPSIATHKKDAARILEWMRGQGLLSL